jgi:hypothetical protein
MTVAERRSRDAGHDAKDGTESIIHAVDCIAHPTRRLRMSLVTRCNQIIEGRLRLVCGESRKGSARPYEVAKRQIVLTLIRDHFLEDGNTGFVA